jgi:hypothetical protein
VEIVTGEMAGEFPDRGRLAAAIRAAFAEGGPLRDPAPKPL